MKNRFINKLAKWMLTGVILSCISIPVFSQTNPPKAKINVVPKSAPKVNYDKLKIDSLEMEIGILQSKLLFADSLYQAEKFTTADLRDQVIKLDDYRLKLEGNVNSFKGENMKLNQSNRILIVFNSLVAVLLIISLVFFLKKLGSKKPSEGNVKSDSTDPLKPTGGSFVTLEEKLQQLERLGKLREKGLLSESEFLAEKQQILGK